MSPFKHTDPTFASGSPGLRLPEPSLLLQEPPFFALGRTIRNSHAFDAHRVCSLFICCRVKTGIRGECVWRSSELLLMNFNRLDQQRRIRGALRAHFVMSDDLIFRFLNLDESSELGRF